ncbi:enoyl-CoA hydratase/isomerase family protein [Vannielia litorea]|uniref:enoyl-CoA hydratase/isomerase family protein n=1 Tax=Vannielia litorea TaxID=1217970 RepID=UPI001C956996|nr:enoyl-CoA hydratase/isomerase family protein [Vannielia litorea]MBY6046896.1 enoyl-CoA hydratase/isomerase family protein [Vannielia litorea]MBY6074310.1 enoyl-CoA hydratase/isomerase family protein [Vannielia litorea]
MTDIRIRTEGRAGRITLNREKALNALSYDMCMAVDEALKTWASDPAVQLVLIDAEGEKAFCAGGDIVEMHSTGTAGDYAYGRKFWRDEYAMNARLATYPKPVVAFMQGFTMGGGVGLGCHASTRIVGASSQIAMPECGIGLVPDVGGSYILAKLSALHPGAGAWIGTTGHRLKGMHALFGFADHFVDEQHWPTLKAAMCESGAPGIPAYLGADDLAAQADFYIEMKTIAAHFNRPPGEIAASLAAAPSELAQQALKALSRADPLAAACHIEILRRLGPKSTIREALTLEYRFTHRCMEQGNFLEGIRAAVIDKDRSPKWPHAALADVPAAQVEAMLAPLGADDLTFPEDLT